MKHEFLPEMKTILCASPLGYNKSFLEIKVIQKIFEFRGTQV